MGTCDPYVIPFTMLIMKRVKNVTYTIVAVPLPIEDLCELAKRSLVYARTAPTEPLLGALSEIKWEDGTGVICSRSEISSKTPDDFACDVIDEMPIEVIENVGQSSIYVKPEVFKDIRYHVSKIEVVGAVGSGRLTTKLKELGFQDIQQSEVMCVAIRGDFEG